MPEYWSMTCGGCGLGVGAELVAGAVGAGQVAWLRCPSCGEGSVRSKEGAVYPPAPAGGNVRYLPGDVGQAWREARTAHAVAAYTAAEIMCRKILMHLAVDVAEAKEGRSFVQYVDALDGAGYVTTGMKPVVDRIRERGNVANHELAASSEEDSLTTIAITEHLLRSIYELPGLLPTPKVENTAE